MSDGDVGDRSMYAPAPPSQRVRPDRPPSTWKPQPHASGQLRFVQFAREPGDPAAPGWHFSVGGRPGFIPAGRDDARACPCCGDRPGVIAPLCDGCVVSLLGFASIRLPAPSGVQPWKRP